MGTKYPFFTIGFIKCSEPYYLSDKILRGRDRMNFHDEMKFNKLSKNNIGFAKFALDTLLTTKSINFASYSLDKEGSYFLKNFGGDPWKAYEDIAIRLLESTISENEIIFVIADYVTTPPHIKFEVNVKRQINNKLKRLAIGGICRFDSKSNNLLQLADLIIGTINYDLKLSTGLILRGDKYKRRLLQYFKRKIGIKDFIDGFHKKPFNIFVDKDVKIRLTLSPPILKLKK